MDIEPVIDLAPEAAKTRWKPQFNRTTIIAIGVAIGLAATAVFVANRDDTDDIIEDIVD